MPLSATVIKTAKPKEKNYKLSDERGLYLLVTPKGVCRQNIWTISCLI